MLLSTMSMPQPAAGLKWRMYRGRWPLHAVLRTSSRLHAHIRANADTTPHGLSTRQVLLCMNASLSYGRILRRIFLLGVTSVSCARSTECVSTWLPREQWELCAQSLLAQGLHHVDARTVPLHLQVAGAAMVRQATQGSGRHSASVDALPCTPSDRRRCRI